MTRAPEPGAGTRARDPLHEARRLFAEGWLSKARRATEAVLVTAPNYAPAHVMLARVALAQDNAARAEACAERALQSEAANPDALAVLGECHVRAGRHEQAVSALGECVAHAPANAQALAHLAFAHQSLGNIGAAVEAYERAIALEPDSALLQHNYATALKRGLRFDAAIEAYERAAELDPEDAGLQVKLGVCLNENARFDEAVCAFERALELEPGNPLALEQLSYAYMKLEDGPHSVAAARALLTGAPDDTGAQLVLGRALMTEGSAREAHDVFARVLERVPDNRNAFADDAIALAELGRADEARQIADLDALLEVTRITTPEAYASIEDFNDALVAHMRGHPVLNLSTNSLSCHHGHTSDELLVEPKGPVALLEAQLHMAAAAYRRARSGPRAHPYVAMLPDKWELSAWTTTLARQGYQHGHIHALAHLSGVYYVSLPPDVTSESSDAGWIEFGRAPFYYPAGNQGEIRTVRPEPGMLLLFPSYVYHRTIPFESDEPRITIAFDFRRA